jgi:2-iminobutanoate/2-iminopropanoate deaminase
MEQLKRQIKHPHRDAGFVTGAYSDAVIINGFVFVSGQASVNFQTSEFVLGTIEEETRRTLDNIKLILTEAGSSMEYVVKCAVHLSDIADFGKYNAVYSEYFPGTKPARTTVQSVLSEGIRVEIDCIAYIPDQK